MAFPREWCQLEEMATWSYALSQSSIPGNALDLNGYSDFSKQMQEKFDLSFLRKHWFLDLEYSGFTQRALQNACKFLIAGF